MLLRGRGQALVWVVALVLSWAHAATPPPTVDNEAAGRAALNDMLREVSHLSSGSTGTACAAQPFYRIAVDMDRFEVTRQKVDLIVRILRRNANQELLKDLVGSLLESEGGRVREVRLMQRGLPHRSPFITFAGRPSSSPITTTTTTAVNTTSTSMEWVDRQPWFWGQGPYGSPDSFERFQEKRVKGALGRWTFPYFVCEGRRWLVSYTAPLQPLGEATRNRKASDVEVVSVDIDLTSFDINQCDGPEEGEEEEEEEMVMTEEEEEKEEGKTRNPLSFFKNSHKCNKITSEAVTGVAGVETRRQTPPARPIEEKEETGVSGRGTGTARLKGVWREVLRWEAE